jgi:hypothetical protein
VNLPALISGVERALAEARTIDDVRSVRDRAKALQRMTKGVAGARQAYNQCGEIVVYALAREGEELARMEKAKGGGEKGVGRRGKQCSSPEDPHSPTLADLGISKKEAMIAQRIAAIPKPELRKHLDAVKQDGGEVTTAGVLRLAKGNSPSRPKRKAAAKKSKAFDPIDECTMLVRQIVLNAFKEIPAAEWDRMLAALHSEVEDIERVINRRKTDGHHAASESA